jgi:hypothetical protein
LGGDGILNLGGRDLFTLFFIVLGAGIGRFELDACIVVVNNGLGAGIGGVLGFFIVVTVCCLGAGIGGVLGFCVVVAVCCTVAGSGLISELYISPKCVSSVGGIFVKLLNGKVLGALIGLSLLLPFLALDFSGYLFIVYIFIQIKIIL